MRTKQLSLLRTWRVSPWLPATSPEPSLPAQPRCSHAPTLQQTQVPLPPAPAAWGGMSCVGEKGSESGVEGRSQGARTTAWGGGGLHPTLAEGPEE